MIHIYCPYCGTAYDIDKSLMPEGNVRVKCRICSNIFTVNKETGVIKNDAAAGRPEAKTGQDTEPEIKIENFHRLNNKKEEENQGNAPQEKEHALNIEADKFMKSIIGEIDESLNQENKKAKSSEKDYKNGGKKAGAFQLIMLIVLILIFIAVCAYTLNFYNIVNLPFIPADLF